MIGVVVVECDIAMFQSYDFESFYFLKDWEFLLVLALTVNREITLLQYSSYSLVEERTCKLCY